MSEKPHGEHHGGGGEHAHAEHAKGHDHGDASAHKAEHGHGEAHGGHEKKGKKEGLWKSVVKELKGIFTVNALYNLAKMVSEKIVKPIAHETAKGVMETPARIISQAVSKVGEGGGGDGGHGHGGSHGGH